MLRPNRKCRFSFFSGRPTCFKYVYYNTERLKVIRLEKIYQAIITQNNSDEAMLKSEKIGEIITK